MVQLGQFDFQQTFLYHPFRRERLAQDYCFLHCYWCFCYCYCYYPIHYLHRCCFPNHCCHRCYCYYPIHCRYFVPNLDFDSDFDYFLPIHYCDYYHLDDCNSLIAQIRRSWKIIFFFVQILQLFSLFNPTFLFTLISNYI